MIIAIVIGSIVSYILVGGCIAGYWLAANGKHWSDYHPDYAWCLLFLWAFMLPPTAASKFGGYLAEKAKVRTQKRIEEQQLRRLEIAKREQELKLIGDQLDKDLEQRRLGQ
jgi:hypothetical protein